MKKLIENIGAYTISAFTKIGKIAILTYQSFISIYKAPKYIQQIVEQFIYIGRRSLVLVIVISIFVGLAIGVEVGFQMTEFTPHWTAGGLILRTILIDIGPLTLGLVLSGRVSAGVASELGTMKVTEQIDALRSFAIDPVEYLVTPRLIAAMFAVPTLLIFSNFISIYFGYYSCRMTINLTWNAFVKGLRFSYNFKDIIISLIKAFTFGVAIVVSGAFYGLNSQRGAKGVGKATTQAVVLASIMVFILSYLVSLIMFYI
ncbi:MlaE family ABC transporter permease [Melioribacteraceae bacterium 4301-Me]|uniref:MlaE family ABC transporter permease n=1 Tax=Pyranulibacter aquaticus TaxID=3163344 RepID=UPI003599A02F